MCAPLKESELIGSPQVEQRKEKQPMVPLRQATGPLDTFRCACVPTSAEPARARGAAARARRTLYSYM